MNRRFGQRGVTLTEMIVVIGGVAILASLTIPTVRVFQQSVESPGATRSMISGALASARAIAAKEQRYAGIRFQIRPDRPTDIDPMDPHTGSQYMIFIVHNFESTDLANGFHAVEGLKPIRLPESVGVMGVTDVADVDAVIATEEQTTSATTFSVVFSPAGRLVLHDVRVTSSDTVEDVFNTQAAVLAGDAMFYQDNDGLLGLDQESSVNRFVIFDRKALRQAYDQARPYNGFWNPVHMNPYTGTMILQD